MGQQSMDKPPTKAKPSAEAEQKPEPRQIEPAPVVAIAGVRVRRAVPKKDGTLAWQKLKGRPSEGAELVNLTRWAIAVCDGDPLEVVKTVIAHLPEPVRAKCKNVDRDPVEIGREIARLIPDKDLRDNMIERRLDCFDRYPDVEEIADDRFQVDRANVHLLDKLRADLERVDRANIELLQQSKWRKIPEKVLRAILRELGRPRPDNVTRYEVNWD
jgi:hypothetical protein